MTPPISRFLNQSVSIATYLGGIGRESTPEYAANETHSARVEYSERTVFGVDGMPYQTYATVYVATPVVIGDRVTFSDGVTRYAKDAKRHYDYKGTFSHSEVIV